MGGKSLAPIRTLNYNARAAGARRRPPRGGGRASAVVTGEVASACGSAREACPRLRARRRAGASLSRVGASRSPARAHLLVLERRRD